MAGQGGGLDAPTNSGRDDVAAIERRQELRLRALIDCARARSPYYPAALRSLPASGPVRLVGLPSVSKAEMMQRFDDWVTDPAVTRAGVQEFLRDSGAGRGGVSSQRAPTSPIT